jgi:hypothetical protein
MVIVTALFVLSHPRSHHLGKDYHKSGQRAERGGDSQDKRADPVVPVFVAFRHQLVLFRRELVALRDPMANFRYAGAKDQRQAFGVAAKITI